jgi:hypothetical protein
MRLFFNPFVDRSATPSGARRGRGSRLAATGAGGEDPRNTTAQKVCRGGAYFFPFQNLAFLRNFIARER